MAKLVEGAITIESSRMLSSGIRVSLALDPTIKIRNAVKGGGGFGIYPGAIVALKGRNGGGGYFLATEVLGVSIGFSCSRFFLDKQSSDSAAKTFACRTRDLRPETRPF